MILFQCQTDRFLKTFFKEKLPDSLTFCEFVCLDGNSLGIEFLPMKLCNILPATLNTEIFLTRVKSAVEWLEEVFLAFGRISGIFGS